MYESVHYCGGGLFQSNGLWSHPERTSNSYELIFVLEGNFHLYEDGHDYQMGKNSFLLFEPGLRHHGGEPVENVSFCWLHFLTDKLPPIPKYRRTLSSYHLTLLQRQILHFANLNTDYSEGCDYFIRLILMELTQQQSDATSGKLRQIAEWIRTRQNEPLRATQVAAAFGYNADYLNRAFQKTFGQSVKSYIDQTKQDYIKMLLLTTNDTLQAIAAQSGFADYKYFLKFFHSHEGMTPTAFRNVYSHTHINIR